MPFLAVCLFQCAKADLPYQVGIFWLYLFGFAGEINGFQLFRDYILGIQLLYLLHPVNGKRILLAAVLEDIPHQVLENVFFDKDGCSPGHLQGFCIIREMLKRVQIGVQLVVQAAFQATALSAELGLIDRKVLIAGRGGVHAFKIGKPGAAA